MPKGVYERTPEMSKNMRIAAFKRWGNSEECRKNSSKLFYQTLYGKLYHMYHNINRRCNTSDCPQYKDYGGRGIQNLFGTLESFIKYITEELEITKRSQIDDLVLDRIDNDGNYEPGNLRFITHSKSQYNRRSNKS